MNRLDEISDEITQGGSAFADYVMGDPAVWWRQLLTNQQQLETAVELAAAYRWSWSHPDQPECDDWQYLLAAAGAPDACDLFTAAQICRTHIAPRLQEDRMLVICDCLLRTIHHYCEVPTAV